MSERNSTSLPISGSRLDEGDPDLTADLDLSFDGAEDILRSWRRGMRPDPDLTVSEWADAHRKLSSRASAEPGQYRTARTPYLREIMDVLSPGHPAQRISFMKAAQVGATEAGNNWIGFVIHHAPGPMLAVPPTVEMAKRTSRGRIDPLIEDSPALRERVQPARSRDAGNSMLSKEFPGGILVLTGANSATGLRSMPARYIFLDEVDAYPASADEEGDPVTLAEARTTTFFYRRKVFMVSTPTIRGLSRIEREFEAIDQRRYFVPCPPLRRDALAAVRAPALGQGPARHGRVSLRSLRDTYRRASQNADVGARGMAGHGCVVHAKRAALFIVGHSLDHRSENVGVDLRPIETANMDQVRARDLAEAGHVHCTRKQPAIHVGEDIRPTGNDCRRAIVGLGVHRAEKLADHLMGV